MNSRWFTSKEWMILAFNLFTFSNLQGSSEPPYCLTSSHLPWVAPIFVPLFSQWWLYFPCGGVPHVPVLHVNWAFCNQQFALLCRVLHSCSVPGALIFSFAHSLVVCLLSEGWLSSSVPLQWIVNPWERRVASCKKKNVVITFPYIWHVAILHKQKSMKSRVNTCLHA